MRKKLIGLFLCLLLVASIPLAAGIEIEEDEGEQTSDLIGITWLRGFIFNPKVRLGKVHARAIRLHYVELTGMETDLGIVRVRSVSFRDGVMLRYFNIGPLGSLTYVIGLTYGGIDINN